MAKDGGYEIYSSGNNLKNLEGQLIVKSAAPAAPVSPGFPAAPASPAFPVSPADLAGLLALAVCSATIARHVEVEPRPGWREPA